MSELNCELIDKMLEEVEKEKKIYLQKYHLIEWDDSIKDIKIHTLNKKILIGKNEKQNITKSGDLIFTGSSEIESELAMSSIVKTKNNYYVNSFCHAYHKMSNNSNDDYFIGYLFRSSMFRNYIKQIAPAKTKRCNLRKD
jgi:hypothetical protein